MSTPIIPDVILASSSPYRQQLLAQVRIHARCVAPNIDESPKSGETSEALALRLARAKAAAIANQWPNAIVIGSDQVASLEGRHLGKPGNAACAVAQLLAQSGKRVTFYTAVCVQSGNTVHADVVPTHVNFRILSEAEITRYVQQEKPFDCAGSFKSEGLGISLFDSLCSEDPSALVGLPLIRTLAFLREFGITVP